MNDYNYYNHLTTRKRLRQRSLAMNSCGRNVLFVAAAVLLLSCQQAYSAAVADSSPLALIQHHAPPPAQPTLPLSAQGQVQRPTAKLLLGGRVLEVACRRARPDGSRQKMRHQQRASPVQLSYRQPLTHPPQGAQYASTVPSITTFWLTGPTVQPT